MKHCIIGDVHGCYDQLQQLLELADVDLNQEQLWFTGDLVGRGPQSLETLRFISSLGEQAQTVLGNHDLHFLAVAEGISPLKAKDKLESVIKAPDKDELIDWLWQQPLLAQLNENVIMVHAGITPQWNLSEAIERAKEVEHLFAQPEIRLELLQRMYGDHPNYWQPSLSGFERYRFIMNSFTRMRCCYSDLSLDFKYKEAPENAPESLHPWFDYRKDETTILFGHWASLMGKTHKHNIKALDTGCVWGNQLTLLRFETEQIFQVTNNTRPC